MAFEANPAVGKGKVWIVLVHCHTTQVMHEPLATIAPVLTVAFPSSHSTAAAAAAIVD